MWACHLHPQSRSAQRGFTLLELIAVITILGIMASLAIPRLVGNERREFRLAVEQVADLLTMYAQRQMLGQKIVGISHDRTSNSLELLIIDTDSGLSGELGYWRADSYVQPVALPSFMHETDVTFVVDGFEFDPSEYPLSSEIGQDRPHIEIHMRGAGQSAVVSLPPYGVAPTIHASYSADGFIRATYDLDRSGRSREDW